MTSSTALDSPFAILSIEGKGQGALARRLLIKGELILSEPPLFVQNRLRSSESIRLALSRLPIAQQREYLGLANCHRKTVDPFRGVFETNCLPLGNNSTLTGEQAGQGAIFLTASRFNSSCVPNTNHRYDENLGQEKLYAMRGIAEGEELCVSYVADPFQPRAVRRAELQQKFNFLCTCAACSLEGESLLESDSRRLEIGSLYEEIGRGGNPRETLAKVKRALALLKQEGLYHYRHSFYYDGFQCCVMVSDFQNAKAWMKRAYDVVVVSSGSDCDELKKYQSLLERPQSHQAAGLRPRAKLSGPPMED